MPYSDPEAYKKYHAEYRLKNKDKIRAANRAWYALNKDYVATKREGYYQKNKEHLRAMSRKFKYGITKEQFAAMSLAQNHACAICGKIPDAGAKGPTAVLHVDHSHTTGAVRGLLCSECNKGLGLFKDSVQALNAAATYLENLQLTNPAR